MEDQQIQEIFIIITKLNTLAKELESLEHIHADHIDNTHSDQTDGPTFPTIKDGVALHKDACFKRHRSLNSPIKLLVDGVLFTSSWDLLATYPYTRLGKLSNAASIDDVKELFDNYDEEANEFAFNKRNKNFSEILDLYKTGSLHISDDNCVIAFELELQYWAIPSDLLEPCCLRRFLEAKEQLDTDDWSPANNPEDEFPDTGLGKVRKFLWDLFENPHTSEGARVVAIISVGSIVLATVILTLNSLPYFQEKEDRIGDDYFVFAIIEAVYMSWFTMEFVVRLLCCPSFVRFVQVFMNWIDFLSILPYFIDILMYLSGASLVQETLMEEEGANRLKGIAEIFRLFRIIKSLRIVRMFKLARHSTGLQALGYTMQSNYKELGLLMLFLGMGAIMFSSLTYVFECDDKESSFKTMLDAYWWAIITMTTIGYGDIYPVTGMGKVIGTLCAIFGVLVIGLPVPIIGRSFNNFYAREKRRDKLLASCAGYRTGQKYHSLGQSGNFLLDFKEETGQDSQGNELESEDGGKNEGRDCVDGGGSLSEFEEIRVEDLSNTDEEEEDDETLAGDYELFRACEETEV